MAFGDGSTPQSAAQSVATASPAGPTDKGMVADFVRRNFGEDLVKLQKDYLETVEHPEKFDKFAADASSKFREISTAADKIGIHQVGISFTGPQGEWGVGTRGADETPGAMVNASSIAAQVAGGGQSQKRADSTNDVDRSNDAGIVRSTPDQSNDKGIVVRSNAGGPRPM